MTKFLIKLAACVCIGTPSIYLAASLCGFPVEAYATRLLGLTCVAGMFVSWFVLDEPAQ